MKIKKMLQGRCPRCGEGKIFGPGIAGLIWAMRENCDGCGLRFMREEGYFLGAMYISYGLGVITVLPVAVVLAVVLEWPLALALILMALQTLASVPLFLRYSRVIWLYFDQSMDPR